MIATVRLVYLDRDGRRRETVYLPDTIGYSLMGRDCERYGRKPLYLIRVKPRR